MITNRKFRLFQRDNNWLLSRLDYIWTKFFPDIEQTNKVFIKFGRFAKLRLGSIRFDKKSLNTYITITAMFNNPQIPQAVIDHTIAHELIHYTHGFSSPHPKLHKYPHAGGLIRQEMEERGMGHLWISYKDWIKGYRLLLRRNYRRGL